MTKKLSDGDSDCFLTNCLTSFVEVKAVIENPVIRTVILDNLERCICGSDLKRQIGQTHFAQHQDIHHTSFVVFLSPNNIRNCPRTTMADSEPINDKLVDFQMSSQP